MAFWDFHKLFTYVFTPGPLDRQKDRKNLKSAGTTQPDVGPDIRTTDGNTGAGGFIRIQNELVDYTTTTNRGNRYKEYDRLVTSCPEIEMAMTVFADEACVAGDTEIPTLFHGYQRIDWLAKNKPNERFPIYCYDFDKHDYTIGWAFNPRLVKKAPTVCLCLDNGGYEYVTADHRILTRDGEWRMAGDLKSGTELMPFYRVPASQGHTKLRTNQFPRIWTHSNQWVHERQFIDEWRLGRKLSEYDTLNRIIRTATQCGNIQETADILGHQRSTIAEWLKKHGFTYHELRYLNKRFPDRRRIVGVVPGETVDVYDLSVEDHENFCTRHLVMHNCQKNEEGHVFKIECENTEVVDELKFLFFHRSMLNFDQRACWDKCKRLFIKGDSFWEVVINPDNPKEGIFKIQDLPPESMYRIETTKNRLLEFQQSLEGPDYEALKRGPITTATDAELAQSTAARFAPEQIIHIRLGDFRKTFYPYGVSLIEAARGPAHQLRMMEDCMVVYRLSRAPERRVFYIDVGQLPPFRAQAFMERMKDQFRKKKVVSGKGNTGGASAVEEKFHAPAQDEDIWIPIRPNSNTRVDTLPGAENLGEIDDTVYFRNKLFTALNFPKNYFSLEDPNATRITLSAQDVKFARMIERLQSYFEEALWEIADRHLKMRGYPTESYEDLIIKMTPPSDWRELSRAEVVTNRINNANGLKGSQLLSDYDILTKWMKYTEEETNEMISRLKIQKLEDLKLQVLAQNPQLLGVGMPGQGENEIGTEPGGPNPNLGPQQPPPQPGPGGEEPPPAGAPVPQGPPMPPPPQGGGGMMPPAQQAKPLPDPTEEDILKYDLDLQTYDSEQDVEDIDFSEAD